MPALLDRRDDSTLVHVISEIDVVLAYDDGIAAMTLPPGRSRAWRPLDSAEEGGRDEAQRGSTDNQPTGTDLQNEGNHQHRAQARADQVPRSTVFEFSAAYLEKMAIRMWPARKKGRAASGRGRRMRAGS